MSVTPARRDRVREILVQASTLTDVLPGVRAIALVGSWARDAARPDSDVDLVVLTDRPDVALDTMDWTSVFGEADVVRAADFGAVQERRLRLADGLVVEVGIAHASWAATDPLDAGTERVAGDGLLALHDPEGLLDRLLRAVGGR